MFLSLFNILKGAFLMEKINPVRTVKALIFIYSKLLIEEKRARGMVGVAEGDIETFKHLLTEEERVKYRYITEDLGVWLAKVESGNIRKNIWVEINEVMNKIPLKDLRDLFKELQELNWPSKKNS